MIKWLLLIVGLIHGIFAIALEMRGNGSSGIVGVIFHIYIAAFCVTWQIEKYREE